MCLMSENNNSQKNRLAYRYKSGGVAKEMRISFPDSDILAPIINIGGSYYRGEITSKVSHNVSSSGKINVSNILMLSFVDGGLPASVENRVVTFRLAEFIPITIGLLGISDFIVRPFLESESSAINLVDLNLHITAIKKEKKFTREEKRLLKNIFKEVQNNKSTNYQ